MPKSFANTPTKRFIKLTSMSAKVAGKYTRARIKSSFGPEENRDDTMSEFYDDVGEHIMQTLGEMKGAAMKVGQIASQVRHLFPDEFSRQIAKLQKQSPPMPYEVIEEQIKSELGFLPEQLFASFDKEPFAAASIGQVHKAITRDGREIIIKVQYPGVYESCRSDLVHLKRVFALSGLLKVDKESLDEVFDEIEAKLLLELDYQAEADNLREFKQFHAEFEKIIIPEVIDEYTTERILSLSYEPGDGIETLREQGYSQEQINNLAITLVEAILREVLYHEKAHCDPHPGNFAFRKDGSVIIYDYGCVADMQDFVVDHYIEILQAGFDNEFHRIDGMLINLGVRNPDISALPPEKYQEWFEEFVAPIINEQEADKAIQQIQLSLKDRMEEFFGLRGFFKPSADTLFMNRVIGGHFLNLAQMGIDVDLKPVVLSHVFED